MLRKNLLFLIILFTTGLLVSPVNSQIPNEAEKSEKTETGGDSFRFHQLKSKIFGNTRTIRVLLPPGYDQKPLQKYPVLYLNDGQNLFDASTSFRREIA
ncbi:MAG: alpha/beta hydrolase-fold protein [Pyrinomonadaceae bacterium]